MTSSIPLSYHDWWRIVETGMWVNNRFDILAVARLHQLSERVRTEIRVLITKTALAYSGDLIHW